VFYALFDLTKYKNSKVLSMFFKSSAPHMGNDLRDVGEECQQIKSHWKVLNKGRWTLPDMDNVVD